MAAREAAEKGLEGNIREEGEEPEISNGATYSIEQLGVSSVEEGLESKAQEEDEERSETSKEAAHMEQLRGKAVRTRRAVVLFPSDKLA